MKRLNQDGLGGLEIMLILAVLLLAAGAGVYAYSKHHKGGALLGTSKANTPVVYNGSANSSAPNGVPAGVSSGGGSSGSAGTSSGSSASATTVVNISGGGFQITVPNSIKDLTYQVRSGSPLSVTFSTQSLTTAVPGCSATSGNGAFDTIVRGNGTYSGNASGGLLHQYSGYYLAYVLPNAPCAKGLSPQNQALLDGQAQDFYNSLSSVAAN